MSGDVRVWDVLTGREVAKWPTPVRLISSIRLNPESHLALLANERDRYAIVDIRDGRVLAEPVDGWSMSNDWRMIALPNEDGISVIRLDDPDSILNMRIPNATATAFSNDARELVAADSSGLIRVWQLDATSIRHFDRSTSDRVSDVFFTNDDRRIVAVSKPVLDLVGTGTGGLAHRCRGWRRKLGIQSIDPWISLEP